MDRQAIREAAEAIIKRGTAHSDALNTGINLALRTFCNKHDFRGMMVAEEITTIEDIASYTLPSDYHHLLEASLIDGVSSYPILIKSRKWVRKRWPYPSALPTGKPRIGSIGNRQITFYPMPDAAYTIQLTIYKIPSLDSDDEENPVPELDTALVYATAAFGFDLLERHQTANVWSARAWGEIQDAIRTEGRNGTEYQHDRVLGIPETEYYSEPYLNPFDRGVHDGSW